MLAWVCCILPLSCWDMSPVSLDSPELLSWRDAVFCQRTFLQLTRWSCGLFSWVYYIVDYIYWFMYVVSFLHFWNEANLIMVDNLLCVFLNSAANIYWEFFHLCSWERSDSSFLSCCHCAFVWFGFVVTLASYKEWAKYSLLSCFTEWFEKSWCLLFSEGLVELWVDSIWSWAFWNQEIFD